MQKYYEGGNKQDYDKDETENHPKYLMIECVQGSRVRNAQSTDYPRHGIDSEKDENQYGPSPGMIGGIFAKHLFICTV